MIKQNGVMRSVFPCMFETKCGEKRKCSRLRNYLHSDLLCFTGA